MRKPVQFILQFAILSCLLFSGCSSERTPSGQLKTSAVTGATAQLAPYITENHYFFAGLQQTLSSITSKIRASVVSIGILESGSGGIQVSNIGSGVIIDPRGYVLTANQIGKGKLVTGNSYKIMLYEPGRRHQFDGQIAAHDPGANLTLIKINSPNPFPFAFLGNSSLLKPGDWLIAFGSADGLTQKIVPGVISSSSRAIKIGGRSFRNIIQTDITTEPGCIGGPLIDLQGKVVGINIGSGRAINISQAAPLLRSINVPPAPFQGTGILPSGRTVASQGVFNMWLGAEVVAVESINAKRLNVPWRFFAGRRGLLINRVVAGSPADTAGIIRGDVVYIFNRRGVGTVKELERVIRRIKPGKVVPVKVVRGGVKQNLYIKVDKKPVGVKNRVLRGILGGAEADWMGVEIGNMTKENIRRFKLSPSDNGVVIINTEARNSTGLRRGDLIRKVNGRKVGEIGEFLAVVANSKKGMLLDVLRQGEPLYLTVGQK